MSQYSQSMHTGLGRLHYSSAGKDRADTDTSGRDPTGTYLVRGHRSVDEVTDGRAVIVAAPGELKRRAAGR